MKEFLEKENYALKITGFQILNEMYAIAYLVVKEADMIAFRDALRPHRGEVFEE